MIQLYARAGGLLLIVGGLFGFLVGEHSILEPLDIFYVEDAVHVLLGAGLAYAAFTPHGQRFLGAALGGAAILAMLVGVAGFMPMSHWFAEHGVNPRPWGMAHSVFHFAIGVPTLAIWYLSRRKRTMGETVTAPTSG